MKGDDEIGADVVAVAAVVVVAVVADIDAVVVADEVEVVDSVPLLLTPISAWVRVAVKCCEPCVESVPMTPQPMTLPPWRSLVSEMAARASSREMTPERCHDWTWRRNLSRDWSRYCSRRKKWLTVRARRDSSHLTPWHA